MGGDQRRRAAARVEPRGASVVLLEPKHCAHNHLAQLPPSWRNRPHGLLGQTYDRDKLEVNGRRDSYARLDDGRPTASRTSVGGDITTRAKAEGAIEGSADLYEVASAHATEFRFSRFEGKLLSSPSPALMMEGTKASSTERGA